MEDMTIGEQLLTQLIADLGLEGLSTGVQQALAARFNQMYDAGFSNDNQLASVLLGTAATKTALEDQGLTTITEVGEAVGTAKEGVDEPVEITFTLSAAADSINEGETNTFTVTASSAVEEDTEVTFQLVEGTATLPDFNAGAFNAVTVTIPAGETEATFDVESIAADGTELSETYSVEATVNGQTLTKEVTLLDGSTGAGQTFNLTTGVDVLPGLTGSNGNTVTSGDDTIIGAFDGTNNTLNTTDLIDAGEGTDTLKVIAGADITEADLPSFSNVEILEARSGGAAKITLDTSTNTDLEQLNITATGSGAAVLTGADSTDINVSGAKAEVTIDGGQNVSVTDNTADKNITIGDSTVNNGTVNVVDTKQGGGAIAIDGGTDVTVESTTTSTGTISVGQGVAATDLPSGAISVTQNLNGDGAALTGGAITVDGGTSIDVTVNATNTADAATDNGALTTGAVTATAGDATTDITVTQNLNNSTFTSEASGQVTETASVKFGALKSGDALEVGGLTFTAAKDLTAEEVALAFSELTKADTQDAGGPTTNGIYTDALAGWTSAAAAGDTVVFTSTTANTNVADLAPNLTNTSTNSVAPVVTTTAGAAGTAAATSTNTTVAGDVDVDDNTTASVTSVTVDGFANATMGANNSLDALTNLSLANSKGGSILHTTQTSLDVVLDGMAAGSTLSLDGTGATVATLNLTASGNDSDVDLTAAAVTTANITADAALDLTGGTFGAVETVTVTGAGDVNLADISGSVKTLDASAATGAITATVAGDTAVVTTGTGNDAITVDTAAISKAVNLGAGDDTLTLSAATASVPTAAVDGGEGTDTVAMTSASAQALDANTNFKTAISGFERLTITDTVDADGGVTIDLEALGFDYVTLAAGTDDTAGGGDVLTLDKLANNGTVVLKDAQSQTNASSTQVNITDAGTNAADVLNLVVSGNADIDAGTVTANDVETFNIHAEDVFVDTTPKDGKDDTNAAHTLTASGDKVTSVVVTGDDLTLDTDSTVLTSVDASAMTGGITYTADGAAAGTTVLGGQGTDVLTASGSNDVLNGGAGNDTLTGANLTQLTGGEGMDTFMMNTPSNVNTYSTITDLSAGDVIDLDAGNAGTVVFSSSAVQLAATAVFQDYANEAINLLGTDADNAAWFQFGGNTYIVQSGNGVANDDFVNGADSIIQITGLVDLSAASYNQTNGTLEIA